MEEDADKSVGDHVRLSVAYDDHDYDIRSDTGISPGSSDRAKPAGTSAVDADTVSAGENTTLFCITSCAVLTWF